MEIFKFGVSFIVFLFVYSFIGLIIDMVVSNSYNGTTYFFRRLIQLGLNIGYICYVTHSCHVNLNFKVKPLNLVIYFIVLFSFIFLYESTIDVFLERLVTPDIVSQSRESDIQTLFNYPIALFIQVCISAPLFEEVLVRGVLYELLRKRLPVIGAVTICSVFFSIMHFDSFNTLFYMMISIIFSYIYIKTSSISYCVILHMCVNAFSVLSYYVDF